MFINVTQSILFSGSDVLANTYATFSTMKNRAQLTVIAEQRDRGQSSPTMLSLKLYRVQI